MTELPNKHQNVRVAVGYRLDAPEGERLEPAKIRVVIEGIHQSTGQPVRHERSVTVVDSVGEIFVEIPGVRNLRELSEVQGFATIVDGNEMRDSGVVPEDPRLAKLRAVKLEGNYFEKQGPDPGHYQLSAQIELTAAARTRVAGNATLSQPSGASFPFVIDQGAISAAVAWDELSLVEGQLAEVVVELTSNGRGTDSAQWMVERQHNRLLNFDLDVVKKLEATPHSPPAYDVHGRLTAEMGFRSASGKWNCLVGGLGSGNLGFNREMGGQDFFQLAAVNLKPSSPLQFEAWIEDEDKSHRLVAEATVPDEPNRLEYARLEVAPIAGTSPLGPQHLIVRFGAVVPTGEGAWISAAGTGIEISGHGTDGGQIDLGIHSTPITFDVTIDGGNSIPLEWHPRLAPADESVPIDPQQTSPEEDVEIVPEIVDADLVAAAATPVHAPASDVESNPRDAQDGIPFRVEIVEPVSTVIIGRRGFIRVAVLDASSNPCPDQSVAWTFAQDDLGEHNHGEFLPAGALYGRTDESGFVELEYQCHHWTSQFGADTDEGVARFRETLEFTHLGQPIGEVTFFIAPPLHLEFKKPLFATKSVSIDYDPQLVVTGGAVTIQPVLSGRGDRLFGDRAYQVQQAILRTSLGSLSPGEPPAAHTIRFGDSSAGQTIEFEVHLEDFLYRRFRRLNRAGQQIDAQIDAINAGQQDAQSVDSIDADSFGSGKIGSEVRQFILGYVENAAGDDLIRLTESQIRRRRTHVGDLVFLLEHSLAVRQAFTDALRLNELAYRRTRDNAAHLTLELLLFGPFLEGVRMANKAGLRKAPGEFAEHFSKQLKQVYGDKLKSQFVDSAVNQMKAQRRTIVAAYKDLRQKIASMRKAFGEATSVAERLNLARTQVQQAVDELSKLRTQRQALQEKIPRLRQELDDLKNISEDILTTSAPSAASARDKGRYLLEQLESAKNELAAANAALEQQFARHATLEQAVESHVVAGEKILRDAGASSTAELQALIERRMLEQARIAARKSCLLHWQHHLNRFARDAASPDELAQQIRHLTKADHSSAQRSLQQILNLADAPVEGLDFVRPADWKAAFIKAFQEHSASILTSKFISGELSELLARRDQVITTIVEESDQRSKPLVMADYEPFGYTNAIRYYFDRAKQKWDELVRSVTSGAVNLGQSIQRGTLAAARGTLGWFFDDMVVVALNETLYDVLAFTFRSILGIAMYLIDMFIMLARAARKIPTAVYELFQFVSITERARLIADLQIKGNCSNEFFSGEAHFMLPVFENLKRAFSNVLEGESEPVQAKSRFESVADEAFAMFANRQNQDVNTVIATLARSALQKPVDDNAPEPPLPSLDRLQKQMHAIKNYERDFIDPSGGTSFWATYENALQQVQDDGLSAANLDQIVDWTAWIMAMALRLTGVLGLLSTPITTVGGVAFGAAALGAAELVDVFGALIKTTIATVFTETNVRAYQTSIMLTHMDTYNKLFSNSS